MTKAVTLLHPRPRCKHHCPRMVGHRLHLISIQNRWFLLQSRRSKASNPTAWGIWGIAGDYSRWKASRGNWRGTNRGRRGWVAIRHREYIVAALRKSRSNHTLWELFWYSCVKTSIVKHTEKKNKKPETYSHQCSRVYNKLNFWASGRSSHHFHIGVENGFIHPNTGKWI